MNLRGWRGFGHVFLVGRNPILGNLMLGRLEQLRDDFAKADFKPPDDLVEFFELLREAK
jgi:hypothetical protein